MSQICSLNINYLSLILLIGRNFGGEAGVFGGGGGGGGIFPPSR